MNPQASTALVAETPLASQSPVLILFGRDEGGRPRAAWFGPSDVAAATSAAHLMSLRILPLTGTTHQALGSELAAGRVFSSGRAFVPNVRKDLYRRLVEAAGDGTGLSLAETVEPASPKIPHATAARPTAASATHSMTPRPGDHSFVGAPLPRVRDEIGLGSIVLAHEAPDEGWWEAEVIGLNGQIFSLRWRDYPNQPTFLRKASELALLPPGEA